MVSDVQTLKIYLSGILLQDTTSGKTQERGTHRIQATGHPVRRETSGWPEGKAGEVALVVKNPPANARHVRHASPIAGWGRSPWGGLQHSPVFLPGESPWVEEPGGLQSIGSQKVGYDWSDLACRALEKVRADWRGKKAQEANHEKVKMRAYLLWLNVLGCSYTSERE